MSSPGCALVRAFHRKVLCSFFFSLSLAIPQFELLSRVSSLRLSSGHSGLVLTLNMQPAPPCPALSGWWQPQSSGLLLHWQLQLGTYSVGFILFYLCCPLRFQNSSKTCLWEGFQVLGNFSSFMTPSPGQVSIPNSFVSLFVFYILSYILLKRIGCLSGCLVSCARIQKLFCGSCSTFKWTFDEFVGEKVVFSSYSSAILGPPPPDFSFIRDKLTVFIWFCF